MSESSTVLSSLTDKIHDFIDSSHSEAKQEPPKHDDKIQEGSGNSEVKDEPSKHAKKRLFNRERSLHAIFGGGKGICFCMNKCFGLNVTYVSHNGFFNWMVCNDK